MQDVEHLQLSFLAPVPRGHQVLYARLRMGPDSGTLASFVHDLTSGVVYCDRRLAGPLGSVAAMEDPLGVLGGFSWSLEKRVAGRVSGVVCSADADLTTTRLAISVEASSYR